MDSSSQIITSDCIKIGLYRFFFLEEVLELNSGKIKLTAREAGILKMLCDKRNSTVPREEILTAFWDETDYFTSRSLDVFISKLRKYLSKDKSIQIINERGKGLRLETV
jgi:DNA-binding response OmpR family regulator